MRVIKSKVRVIPIIVQPQATTRTSSITASNQDRHRSPSFGEQLSVEAQIADSAHAMATSSAGEKKSNKRNNVIQALILITACFIVLWMPLQLAAVFVYFEVSKTAHFFFTVRLE
jgi:hypothetical protein